MKDEQLRQLSGHLKEMNDLLERILHAQFGIEDKTWIHAISTMEDGFNTAVNYIADCKEIKITPTALTKEDIDNILER